MAPRRVIEDSDEDDGSFVTPEPSSPSINTNEVGAIPMIQPSSTDPVLFRAVYEEHLGQLLVEDQLPSHGQSPVLEDPITDQRLSSSVSVPSARKIKRSKTINVSSLSSITEPTLSNRKAKRTESMRSVDNLTQITTPKKSKDAIRKDPWEVPTSSASDKPSDVNVKVKSRNIERSTTVKTYGGQIRRTQIVASSTSNNRRLSSSMEDDSPQIMNQNRPLQDQEDSDLTLPKLKRHKTGPSVNVELLETVSKEPLNGIRKELLPASIDFTSTGAGSMSIQVQRGATEHAEIGTNRLAAVHTHDFSSPSLTNQKIPSATVEDSYLLTRSSVAQASRKSLSSIAVVPDTLSDEQKLQYTIVSVASTAQSQQSSSEMLETIDLNVQNEDSGILSNDTPLPKLPLGTVGDPMHATRLSSSPPVSAMSRKMKRAKSEVGSARAAMSATINSDKKVGKRKGRSNTIAPGEKPPGREVSVDELSLAYLDPVRITASREASIKTGKKRAHSDELHMYEKTGLEPEHYQPWPSLRRSRSISIHTSKDGADLEPSYSAFGEKEFSVEIIAQASIIQDNSAMVGSLSAKAITEGCVCQTESLNPESIGDSHDTGGKPADVPVIENVPTGPTRPKKRGRKKTSEIISGKSSSVLKSQSTDAVPGTPREDEVQRKALHETDSNKQPLEETPSTPSTKASTAAVTSIPAPAKTPSKDLKKGLDQHSPLQSGKVPYRVGLSKKTRIAPLLKIIRK